jgi:predicted outer membrane repeat protein
MKTKILLTVFLLNISYLLIAQIIHVPADQPTIQAGIDAANNGDTVLVQPGTYIENINFNSKAITVASYFLIDGDANHISNTIIDGNKSGSVVTIEEYTNSTPLLCGFTIINGESNYGGGIYCDNTRPSLKNLIIANNTALKYGGGIYCNFFNPEWENLIVTENISHRYGGGIYLINSDPIITNVSITHNTATGYYGYGGGIYCGSDADPKFHSVTIAENSGKSGGGIYADSDSKPVFDSINRCNAYLNNAIIGNDLFLTEILDIKLDTFSVLNPTQFYAFSLSGLTIHVNHGMIEQVDADLFVSTIGDNENNGLSPEEPLKTIRHALSLIRADSLHHHTIYLQDGVYSPSSNGETCPINLISNVDMQGESENGTIIDAEDQSGALHFVNCSDINISTLFVTGGNDTYYGGGGIYCKSSSPVLNDITISGNSGYGILCRLNSDPDLQHLMIKNNAKDGVYCQENSSPNFQDVNIINNSGDGIYFSGGSPVLENVDIRNNSGIGMDCHSSNLLLKKVNITHNEGLGINNQSNSSLIFDVIERCNIYLNNIQQGNDLYSWAPISVVVDTFTVLYPTDLYARPISNFTFDILHGVIEQVDADLYVSPSGDDSNSGLNEDDPLKTIRHALSIIIADSLNINTIHLANGVYSQSINGESFPLEFIDYVYLSGASESGVVLDAEGNSSVININNNKDTEISSLTLTGGYAYGEVGCLACNNSNLDLTNITIANNTSYEHEYGGGGDILSLNNSFSSMNNLTISENVGSAIRLSESEVFLNNLEISNNAGSGIGSYSGNVTMNDVNVRNNQGTGIILGGESFLQNVDISYNNRGGIRCIGSNPELENVNIAYNTCIESWSEEGGGIYCKNANPVLRNVRIVNNTAKYGGGMYFNNSNPVFDSINRCNIHSNDAVYGKEFYSNIVLEVIVDTFPVLQPTEYYAEPINNFTFDILNGLFPQVDADVFVSPGGDNTNSGLTLDDPLKTIDYATSILIVDSSNHHTIHLMNGVYSPSTTGEEFPLRVMNYINISGELDIATILTAEGQGSVINFLDNSTSTISNFTVTGGSVSWLECGIYCNNSSVVMNNLIIANNGSRGIQCDNHSSPTIENLVVMNNGSTGIICDNHSSPAIENLVLKNNSGRGISCMSYSSPTIQDVTITGNNDNGVYCNYFSNPSLQNVTISDNESDKGGGLYCGYNSNPELKNVTISSNSAVYGGGIYVDGLGPVFDSIDRCNIYMNDAAYGRDLFSENMELHVIVDTFTVWQPTDIYSNPIDKFTFDIQHGLISQVDADLYVSPEGDDANSGLTQDDPIKTIYHANSIMLANIINPHTINLLDGIYSSSATGEYFPVTVQPYVNLMGQSGEGVILDAEGQSGVIGMVNNDSSQISNLSLIGGSSVKGGGIFLDNSKPVIQNVSISNNEAETGGGIYCERSDPFIHDVIISDNNASTYGGGGAYFCGYSHPVLKNVFISNNSAKYGGGVYYTNSNPYFENTTISYNTAFYGGGIYFQGNSPVFDSINRSNIYFNDAVVGKDLHSNSYSVYDIIVDTFTVLNPTNYYAKDIDSFEFDILHGLIPQVNADLYVSPEGSNNNSGIIPEEPLKTIDHALSILIIEQDSTRNLYLQDGVYSTSSTGETFPISLIDNVNLVGNSADKVIVDAEEQDNVIYLDNKYTTNIENMTITGGFSGWRSGGIACLGYGSSLNLRNMYITNNKNGVYFTGSHLNLQNVVISGNTESGIYSESQSSLQNVTIVNNGESGLYGCNIFCYFDIINSIIYNNEISISLAMAYASIRYSNIEEGWEGEGNIDEDPMFIGIGDHPYALAENSPCIDAGTPDTTGLFLPLFDILGGPRIWNNRIDMGAYEWNNVGIEEPVWKDPVSESEIRCYPNPFSNQTTIEFTIPESELVTLSIYDITGKRLETILSKKLPKGNHKINWNAEGLNEGIYFIQLETDGAVQVQKALIIK